MARSLLSKLAVSHASERPDAALIEACAAFAAMHGAAGSAPGAGRVASSQLRRVAALRATTQDGHQARAAAFVLWDDGDLLGRARAAGILEEVVLRAILIDIVDPPP